MILSSIAALVAASEIGATQAALDAPPKASHGEVVMQCKVAARNRLDSCTILSESPAGAGFGDLALRASEEMQFNGPVGGTLRIPMKFDLPREKKPKR